MVILANANPVTDGSAFNFLSQVNSEIPIVLVSKAPRFRFNEELLRLDKYILICYVEYGWAWSFVTSHIWGENTGLFIDAFDDRDEYLKFDDFVQKKPPLLQFKRELFKQDVRENVLPIEYPAWYKPTAAQSKEEFDSRPISTFFSWGLSNEKRKWLHADIWKSSSLYGYSVCDNLYNLTKFLQEEMGDKWVTVNIPHYARHDMAHILSVNGMSKISISPDGAGLRCFRHSESPLNSIMAMPKNGLAWSYEWRDMVNCIEYKEDDAIETIKNYLDKKYLYQIYVAGVENAKNYYLPNYIKNYIEPTIKQFA
jgi:hypothetical protein